jgi:hypothetical protein
MGQGSGDKLARGAVKAVFPPANDGGKITDQKWKEMFEGFDAEDFKKNGLKVEEDASTGEKETTKVGPAR